MNDKFNDEEILLEVYNYLADIADCLDMEIEDVQFSMEFFSEFCEAIKYVYRSCIYGLARSRGVNQTLLQTIIRLVKLNYFPQKIKRGFEYECLRLLCIKTVYAIEDAFHSENYIDDEDFLKEYADRIATKEYIRNREGEAFYPCLHIWYDFERDTPETVLNGLLKKYAVDYRKNPENFDVLDWSLFE